MFIHVSTLSSIYLLLLELLTSCLKPFSAAISRSIRRRHCHFLSHRRNCLLEVLPGCDMALPEANSGVLSVYLRNFSCSANGSVGPTTCVRDHLLRCQLAKNLSLPCRMWLLLEANWLPTRLTAIDGLRVLRPEVISRELFCRLIRCLTVGCQSQYKLHTSIRITN